MNKLLRVPMLFITVIFAVFGVYAQEGRPFEGVHSEVKFEAPETKQDLLRKQESLERMKEVLEEKNEKIGKYAQLERDYDILASQPRENLSPFVQQQLASRQEQLIALQKELESVPEFTTYLQLDEALKNYQEKIKQLVELPEAERLKETLTYATALSRAEEFITQLSKADNVAKIKSITNSIDKEAVIERVRQSIETITDPIEKQRLINTAIDNLNRIRDYVTIELNISLETFNNNGYAYLELLAQLNNVAAELSRIADENKREQISTWKRIAQTFKQLMEKFLSIIGVYDPSQAVSTLQQQTLRNESVQKFMAFNQEIYGYIDALSTTIDSMWQAIDILAYGDFKKVANKFPDLINSLQSKLDLLNNSSDLAEALNKGQELATALHGKAQRYKGNFATLFEKIAHDVSMIGVDLYRNPEALYQLLGLQGANYEKLTQPFIEAAYQQKLSTLTPSSPEYEQVQKAGFIIRSPEHRKTYDAFINDAADLVDLGDNFSERALKKIRTIVSNGRLAQLEITNETTKNMLEQIARQYSPMPLEIIQQGKTVTEIFEQQLAEIKNLQQITGTPRTRIEIKN